ncbi:uncharacterized protein FFNC_15589 [Fusarium fujikuroi]|jgi:hypothetical protein
MLPG